MWVVYLGTFLVFLVKYSNSSFRKNKKPLKTAIAITMVLTFIAAFKSIDRYYVDDLVNYRNSYLILKWTTYEQLWNQYIQGNLKDFGFWAFSKIFADLNCTVEVWMALIGGCFAIVFSWLCYRYSKDEFVSYLMLIALTFSFTLSGLRQTMALTAVLSAYHWIIKRKKFRYIISMLIAMAFHSTAILFLPAYLICKLKIGKKHLIFIAAFFVASTVFPEIFRSIVSILAWNEQIEGYSSRTESLTWSGFIIQFAIFLFCYIFQNANVDTEDRRVADVFLNCMMVGLCFQSMATIIAEAFRITYYYSICSGIAVANTIYQTTDIRNKKTMLYSVIFVLLIYMVWSGAYSKLVFVWQ